MRKLRVENSLYTLPDEVWREINDLLGEHSTETKVLEEDTAAEPSSEAPEVSDSPDQPEAPEGEGSSSPGEHEH